MTRKAAYRIYGTGLDPAAIEQMENAVSLPVAVKGALMPDAHKGYGLPIGGVLAADNAVIPYAVGVDIACRMRMSILATPWTAYESHKASFKTALENHTRFGMGARFSTPKSHAVMDEDWQFCPIVSSLKDKARFQLGTSGSGNHFAEFGRLVLPRDDLGIAKGEYIALLTHSGSRGTGALVAGHYSTLAIRLNPELGKELKHLAWLSMDSDEGIRYFKSMELMGRYAAACHDIIHDSILKALGETAVASIENHHNFAFREKLGLRPVIVHRKGAIPAWKGTLGIIPGSMADPGYVVRGKGAEESLWSAAHGAGRKMSRNAAIKRFHVNDLNKILKKKNITLLSAGLDEIPMAYKNIEEVMNQQKELVDIVAVFKPSLVRMAPADRKQKRKKRS